MHLICPFFDLGDPKRICRCRHNFLAAVGERVIARGAPLAWKRAPTLLAYSRSGCERRLWKVPAGLMSAGTVTLATITVDTVSITGTTEIKNGEIALSLAPGQAVMITLQTD